MGRIRLPLLAALLALLVGLAACGVGDDPVAPEPDAPRGDVATLWVTTGQGSEVLVDTTVPAGLTAIEALERETELETRFGGRFVQSVDGIEGSMASQEDWFFFVNGIEPDLGGHELELRPGDVVWWDYRDWGEVEQQPVAVGAFPEPFLHGWEGVRRPAEVRAPDDLAEVAEALLATLGGPEGEGEPHLFVLEPREGEEGATLTAERGPRNDDPVTFTLAGWPDAVRAAAERLAGDPAIVHRRYEARFDDEGAVVE